ncbi:MAG: metallophosphoesterase family protein [Bacillota bacterium]
MEGRLQAKKHCRVCGERVNRLYKGSGGKRCAVCLHRTHSEHLAENKRVCSRCREEDLLIPGGQGVIPGCVSILHLTDIHFGREDSLERVAPVENLIIKEGIKFVLVSGDLTARAGREEYEMAAGWINKMESTGVRVGVVPGNHDIGYWGNIISVGRQIAGRKYHRWIEIIDRPIEPCVRGAGSLMLGLNSAHGISPTRFLNGYLNRYQRQRAIEILEATPEDYMKLVFCHHPLVRFEGNLHKTLFNSEKVRLELMEAGAGIFLWGHQHSFASMEMEKKGGKCFAVQSPTLSARTRNGQYPGFSVIDWYFRARLVIRVYRVSGGNKVEEERRVEYIL